MKNGRVLMMNEKNREWKSSQPTISARPFGSAATQRHTHTPVRQFAMGEGGVIRAPHIISSVGIGSCVAVTIYDFKRKIGGLAHIMLPDSYDIRTLNPLTPNLKYKCADTAIAALLEELKGNGAIRQDMVAKMIGGAKMFSSYDDSESGVGTQNIRSIKQILKKERIPLIAEDVGGHHGRNIEFHLDSGKVIVRAMGKEDREI